MSNNEAQAHIAAMNAGALAAAAANMADFLYTTAENINESALVAILETAGKLKTDFGFRSVTVELSVGVGGMLTTVKYEFPG